MLLRRALGEILGNRRKRKELTPYIRRKIKAYAENKFTDVEIAKVTK